MSRKLYLFGCFVGLVIAVYWISRNIEWDLPFGEGFREGVSGRAVAAKPGGDGKPSPVYYILGSMVVVFILLFAFVGLINPSKKPTPLPNQRPANYR